MGGSAYLTSLINLTPTAVNAVHYGRIVERKGIQRNLIGAAGRIAAIGYEDSADVTTSIDKAEQELFRGSARSASRRGFTPLKQLPHSAYDRLDYLHQHKGEISGVRTGFRDLDTLTSGLQKSDLILIAARPSVGKTSLGLNIAEHAAVIERKTVGVFSLEMSKEQLVLRLLSSVSGIDSQRLGSSASWRSGTSCTWHATSIRWQRRRSTSTTHPTSARWSCAPRHAGCRRRPAWT